jgi:hypothetical protein
MRRIIAGMISSASLAAFSSAAGLSDLRPVPGVSPPGAPQRPGLSVAPAAPASGGQASGAAPIKLTPRGSLLDLSV